MAVVIKGSGTVEGISVGGLPDGIVDTDMLAANAVVTGKIAAATIATSDLADDAVTTAKIADAGITTAKMGTKSYISCAFIADKKSQNTAGGSSTGGGHYQRDLNHEFYDPDGIVSISSNDFVIGSAGTYIIEWSCPAFAGNQHVSRLRNSGGTIQEGTCEYDNNTGYVQTRSTGSARVTQSGSETYKIMHRVASSKSTNGFGVPCEANGDYDVYTWVKIYKEA